MFEKRLNLGGVDDRLKLLSKLNPVPLKTRFDFNKTGTGFTFKSIKWKFPNILQEQK